VARSGVSSSFSTASASSEPEVMRATFALVARSSISAMG
jgi:hypothetical protein